MSTRSPIRPERSREKLGAVLFCLGFAFAGCANNSMVSSTPAPQVQPAASITVCNKTPDGCAEQPNFSIAQLRDLKIHVDWKNVPLGTRTQTLEVLDPGGGSFQLVNTSFAEEVAANGAAQADVLIPISGSMIAQRSITGTWVMRVSLDGQLVTTQDLVLQP